MADEHNPFEAPSANPDMPDDPVEGRLQPVEMEVGAILGRCWELFTANIGLVVGALLIPMVPALAFAGMSVAIQLAMEGASDESMVLVFSLADLAVNLSSALVSLFFQLGVIRIFLNIARGNHAELGMLIGEGRNYLSGIGTSFLTVIAILVGFVLLIIPAIIVGLGLQFALYAVVDRNMSPITAMQESWRLTNGHKGTIFLINLVVALIALGLTCVTLGIGYLLAVPVLALTQAVMYHSLEHLQKDQAY